MNNIRLLKQRKAHLANGQVVKMGDVVEWINSDHQTVMSMVDRRKNGTLFIHNSEFDIMQYSTAKLIKQPNP